MSPALMMGEATGQPLDRGSEAADGQRRLLVDAFAKVVAEHGYAGLDMERVLRTAGVSRTAFEAHFESREQILIAAQDAFIDRLWMDMVNACEGTGAWPSKVRAGLGAVLASLAEASALARVFAIEATAASLAATERQYAALERYAASLRDGRRLYPGAASLPDATEPALVGGIASILFGKLLVEDPQAIPALETQLVELLLTPYVGGSEARRVAAS